ncbi:MAG: tRNA (adenosine(37)-N6)-threonylcarbamoyltransferase complex transferase subunit TsaD [Candidatus Sungbacteria bacterium]|uniref:tRNA N6-adenosine threonylcarbamoyltransferase n=1 Tax=Candidatus Sungiibacteriota bacterium TaxID=2750080 RepID=A0A931YDQ1_9BACT|nr:tRNA (adenosine(37)-N6)-threonylcarbamoyltransferase complex transferase subunit TsaD [Candidatus Sungbacteria bacterium]MBI2466054.1 tRNA (adenosine(37)-N6)-threonylcarbamoyltransferase complex transferase subunit TsaD [Candidatus Sungbacteria bacterium]
MIRKESRGLSERSIIVIDNGMRKAQARRRRAGVAEFASRRISVTESRWRYMKILAIETSCDETGMALIESNAKGKIDVLANLVSSQIETHRPYGGVVPNLAKREHLKNLPLLWQQLSMSQRSYSHAKFPEDIDLIAVTNGPGLAPCLWAGINFAQELAQKLGKPLVDINHLKGHIYVALSEQTNLKSEAPNHKQIPISKFQIPNSTRFPILSLIVSGGHTQLVYSKKIGDYKIIGETLDDAAGEAFDKVAKLLGLGYPGGPEISKLAAKGNPSRFNLPRPMLNSKNFDFSFSGLKTAVLYLVKGLTPNHPRPLKLTLKNKADLAASFEQAVVDVLVHKTILVAKNLTPKTLILGGGVAANKKLRRELKSAVKKNWPHTNCLLSPIDMTGDNALMIALAALAECQIISKDLYGEQNLITADLKAEPNLRLD